MIPLSASMWSTKKVRSSRPFAPLIEKPGIVRAFLWARLRLSQVNVPEAVPEGVPARCDQQGRCVFANNGGAGNRLVFLQDIPLPYRGGAEIRQFNHFLWRAVCAPVLNLSGAKLLIGERSGLTFKQTRRFTSSTGRSSAWP
jgi:hypothetical protein